MPSSFKWRNRQGGRCGVHTPCFKKKQQAPGVVVEASSAVVGITTSSCRSSSSLLQVMLLARRKKEVCLLARIEGGNGGMEAEIATTTTFSACPTGFSCHPTELTGFDPAYPSVTTYRAAIQVFFELCASFSIHPISNIFGAILLYPRRRPQVDCHGFISACMPRWIFSLTLSRRNALP
jgi:hypothetical protein